MGWVQQAMTNDKHENANIDSGMIKGDEIMAWLKYDMSYADNACQIVN